MSLTYPSEYAAIAKNSVVRENWLIQLYSDDESAFIGLSDRDIVVSSVQYYGIITSFGEITEQIDLVNSKASFSDIEINCVNRFKNGTLSGELFDGTRKYINRKVNIYSQLNDNATLTNCLLIYTGRLVNISADQESVTLKIEDRKPYDGIYIPTVLSPQNRYQPVAYGDFVPDTNTNFYKGKYYYPMPFEIRKGNKIYFVAGGSLGSSAEAYFYDQNLDRFIKIDSADSSTTASGDVYLTGIPLAVQRTVNIRGTVDGTDDFTPTGYAYDEATNGSSNTSTSARYPNSGTHTRSGTGEDEYTCLIEGIIEPVGRINALSVKTHAAVTIDPSSSFDVPDCELGINFTTYAETGVVLRGGGAGAGTTTDTTDSIDILSEYEADGFRLPTSLEYTGYWDVNDASVLVGYVNIYDSYLQAVINLDWTNEPEAAEAFVKELHKAYCGADGLTQSYTDGSGLATLPHEIHRDLLKRFTDFDYDNDYMTNWSDLATARSGWTCHWWTLDLISLKTVLEQIQYEGCFIFKVGNGGAKYIWVKDSYSGGDVVQTLNETDRTAIQFEISDLSEIGTKTVYNYQRHPALENKYLQQATYTNSTARTAWLIGDNENTLTKNLDFITADKVYNVLSHTNPNDCIALYYNNIISEPKKIIYTTILNPVKMNIEVGDIIKIDDDYISPFALAWEDIYFMVTETRRSPNGLHITAREVYDAT